MNSIKKSQIILFLIFMVNSGSVFADYDLHYTDIYHPMFNFILLFGFIGWKVKGLVSDAFTKNAEEVESLYVVAEEKDKEAQLKLDMFNKKMENIENEKKKIIDSTLNDVEKFEEKTIKEIDANIERLKKDAINKVESEKNEMLRKLNESLLEEVISKTKNTIKNKEDFKQKATEKLLSEVH